MYTYETCAMRIGAPTGFTCTCINKILFPIELYRFCPLYWRPERPACVLAPAKMAILGPEAKAQIGLKS